MTGPWLTKVNQSKSISIHVIVAMADSNSWCYCYVCLPAYLIFYLICFKIAGRWGKAGDSLIPLVQPSTTLTIVVTQFGEGAFFLWPSQIQKDAAIFYLLQGDCVEEIINHFLFTGSFTIDVFYHFQEPPVSPAYWGLQTWKMSSPYIKTAIVKMLIKILFSCTI